MAPDLDAAAAAAAAFRAAQLAVEEAKQLVTARQQGLREARDDVATTLVTAAEAGARMRDLVAATQFSREWIRQILRAAGVEPDRY